MVYFKKNQFGLCNINYDPFSPIWGEKHPDGTLKTKEEMEAEGFFVDYVSEAERIEGKEAILKADFDKKTYYYEHVDIKETKTKEEIQAELNAKLLKDTANMQIELDKQKQLNANLLKQIAQLGGNTNA
ncbi:MAG: hypothetical protein E6274_00600 [Clostridium sp.]|uniref:hypothetical protein n=1 Tax=Clostridium sp. TaxID=1506 RepID=UPI00291163C7|nr:hypothetical protein [Clostridium sp.]MDU7250833.1 hypothetical protein [Clostridium sp.]